MKKSKYDGLCSTHERGADQGAGKNAKGSRRAARALIGLAAFAAAAIACGSDDYYDDYYYDPYNQAYAYYYPADMAYSDVYYTGYYGYPTAYYASSEFGLSPKGKVAPSWPGAAIRDIALGKSICPGQVTVTGERADSRCPIEGEDGADALPASTSMVFDDCVLPDGGRLDGTIEIDVAHTFSDAACGSETVVDVSYTSTSTDLAYTAPGGGQIVLPSLVRSGSFQRSLAGRPSALNVSVQGAVERYDEQGALLVLMTLTGTQTITPAPADDGYSVDGTLSMMMQDTAGERTLNVSGVGVTRTDSCCHPTGGTLESVPSDGQTQAWSFGPGCGDVSLNGEAFAVRECL